MAVWKFTFVPEHSNTDQSQLTKCIARLHALAVAVLSIPAVAIGKPERHVC